MVTDPPYGISLDSEWRDRAGLNGCGPAEASYMKNRTEGHTETTISGDTRADWSDAFALVPSIEVAYVWHASVFTREVLDGLLRIGFLYPQQIIWNKGRTVLTRTHYWYRHEPCGTSERRTRRGLGKRARTQRSGIHHPPSSSWADQVRTSLIIRPKSQSSCMRRPILNHLRRGELVYEPFLGSGTTLAAAELTERVCYSIELDAKYIDVIVQRWQGLAGKKATLDGDGRTFDEIAAERQKEAA
jgi:DNA modification methylase